METTKRADGPISGWEKGSVTIGNLVIANAASQVGFWERLTVSGVGSEDGGESLGGTSAGSESRAFDENGADDGKTGTMGHDSHAERRPTRRATEVYGHGCYSSRTKKKCWQAAVGSALAHEHRVREEGCTRTL